MPTIYRKSSSFIASPSPVISTKLPRISVTEHRIKSKRTDDTSSQKSKFSRLLPAILVTAGSVLIANVGWPIISYQLFVSPTLQQQEFLAPTQASETPRLDEPQSISPVQAADSVQQVEPRPEPTILTEELDYTNLSVWFPSQNIPEIKPEDAKEYIIDIPALDVEQAVVRIGGLNLDKNLIQYPGTASPGELGAPVIFGHSVSPIFYNPSLNNPRRYTSIFTKLMQLKNDDKIIVTVDGISYTYRVTEKVEVKPEDSYILEQQYNVRELKLVTCTPAGTYLRRGVVTAVLEDIQR